MRTAVMAIRLIPLLALFGFQCRTGSNFETLLAEKAAPGKAPEAGTNPVASLVIRPFTFTAAPSRTETFRKGFIIPGYKGIDYDVYGRPDRADERSGMQTISSLPDAHVILSRELSQLELKATPAAPELADDALALSVNISSVETSMRIHTYGCWPFAGTVMYIVNSDIYTVLSHTRLEYKLENARSTVKKGSLDVLTESKFSFWGSYAGFAILESYEEALSQHLKQIAAELAAVLRS